MHAEDFDGIDSVWVTLGGGADERSVDGGFSRSLTWRYRFILSAGQTPGTHIPLSFRTRDAAGFEAQRDTYVVAIP